MSDYQFDVLCAIGFLAVAAGSDTWWTRLPPLIGAFVALAHAFWTKASNQERQPE